MKIEEIGEERNALGENGFGVEAERDRAGDDRTDARSTDRVDRDAQMLECTQHADVRVASGAASSEHEADCSPGEEPCKALKITGQASADMNVIVRATAVEPLRRLGKRSTVGLLEEDERSGRAQVEKLPGLDLGVAVCDEDDA